MTRPNLPWATRVRLALTESRNAGHRFDDAWARALVLAGAPEVTPDQRSAFVKWCRSYFLNGYYGRDVLGPAARHLTAECEAEYHEDRPAPERPAERDGCRWGGEPCDVEPVDGSLFCEDHRARLRAAMDAPEVKLGLWRLRSAQWREYEDECADADCQRRSQTGSPYCGFHDRERVA